MITNGQAPRSAITTRAQVAKQALEARAMRHRHLPPQLFGESGWHILLDLFVSEDQGRQISVSSAIVACGAPPTTAARWIDELVNMGLVGRRPHPADRRSTIVELTPTGRDAMMRWADDMLMGRSRSR